MKSFSIILKGIKDFWHSLKPQPGVKKIPSLKQWQKFLHILSPTEKKIFLALLAVAFLSSSYINIRFYLDRTIPVASSGGTFREGVVGQPRFINPLYLSNQDVDRDLVEVIFSGLVKYDQKGQIIPDLADNYEIKENGNVFEAYLKKGLTWHDGKPLTADDVIFTVSLIQDQQYQSPLRIKWSGISVEKINEDGIRFRLPQKYSGFLENLTLKILPKHIFENISPQNMPWTLLSQKYLIGSGPFVFKKLDQDKSGYIKALVLTRNERYYGKKPFLEKLEFIFCENEEELAKKAERREIDGLSLADPQYAQKIDYHFTGQTMMMPRYFALFFNLRTQNALADKRIREALSLSINKSNILNNLFAQRGTEAKSPILPLFFDLPGPTVSYDFDREKAQKILNEVGYTVNPVTQKREKVLTKAITTLLFPNELKLKDQGQEVKKLQECLNKQGFYQGTLDGIFSEQVKTALIKFQEKYSDEILKPENLKKGNGLFKERTRTKLSQLCQIPPKETVPLKVTIATSDKFPLAQIADMIKSDWEAAGLTVELQKMSLAELQTNVLAKANFEILLFGEALGALPDPFPFWHSSQKDYPGLNIAGYSSKEADKLLENARSALNQKDIKENLEKFQNILLSDLPATFLVRPDYVYFTAGSLKGLGIQKITEPAKRFSDIENWYLKTKRIWR